MRFIYKVICLVQALFVIVFMFWQHRTIQGAVEKRREKGQAALVSTPSSTSISSLEKREVHQTQPQVKSDGKVSESEARNRKSVESRNVEAHNEQDTILIALASYGDMECAPTVARAYQRAAHPDRVFFGIFQQHNCSGVDDAEHCKDCVADIHNHITCPEHPLCTRLWQVRVSRLPMRQTKGVTYGRFMAEKHYRDETFVMNIDSHSHFSAGWDSEVIDMFYRIGDDMALITTYPAHYSENSMGHDKNDRFQMDRSGSDMCICQTARTAIFKTFNFKHVMGHVKRPDKPFRSAFLAAGFNFGRGHRIKRVPYDPYTPFLFDGEETSFGVRAWTHGYDFYHPDKPVVAHLYITSGSKLRPVFWTDDWATRYKVQYDSTVRINYFLGLHDLYDKAVPLSDINLVEQDTYGVGTARTVEQYWAWAQVYTKPGDPEKSKSLCHLYESGGMPRVHRKGIDPEPKEK